MDDQDILSILSELGVSSDQIHRLASTSRDRYVDQRLQTAVIKERESLDIDLKLSFQVESDGQKEEFAKDCVALVNACRLHSLGQKGYLILGAADSKERAKKKGAPSVKRFEPSEWDINQFGEKLQQIIIHYVRPHLHVEYRVIEIPAEGSSNLYGVIEVTVPKNLPAMICDGKYRGVAFGRYGSPAPVSDRLDQSDVTELVRSSQIEDIFSKLTSPTPSARLNALDAISELRLHETRNRYIAQNIIGLLHDPSNEVAIRTLQLMAQYIDQVNIDPLLKICDEIVEHIEDDDDLYMRYADNAIRALSKQPEQTNVISYLQDIDSELASAEQEFSRAFLVDTDDIEVSVEKVTARIRVIRQAIRTTVAELENKISKELETDTTTPSD